jgi:hypothetical protein
MKKSIMMFVVMCLVLVFTNMGYAQCSGPYDYEYINRNTEKVVNDFFNSPDSFCSVSERDEGFYLEQRILAMRLMAWTLEEISKDRRILQGNRQSIMTQVSKYDILCNLIIDQLKADPRKYFMWLDSQRKARNEFKRSPSAKANVKKFTDMSLQMQNR